MNTIVFDNGKILKWRLRDGNYNRFKVCLSLSDEEDLYDSGFLHEVDPDDCDGEEFATICRLMSEFYNLT